MDISIRIAEKSDLPGILAVYAQSELDGANTLSLEQAGKVFDVLLQYPFYHLYVVVSPGRVIATFALLIMENLTHLGQKAAIVEAVGVLPEFQCRGIGKLMMQSAATEARTHNCYKLVLSSNLQRSGSHRFYEALGFQKHGYSFRLDL